MQAGETNDRCFDPWSGLVISYNKRSWVNCCVYADVSDVWTGTSPDLRQTWNSPWFQRLRRKVAGNDYTGTGCRGCRIRLQGMTPRPGGLPGMTRLQRDNLAIAARHWKNGDAVLESVPMELFLTFTASCNLKCIMCSQEDVRHHEKSPDLDAAGLLAQKDVLERATKVWVSGGEPLCSRQCISFIKGFSEDDRLQGTCLTMVTNGLMLDTVLQDLEKLNKLELIISCDGIDKAYERVRRGGNWAKLSRNIDMLIESSAGRGKNNWTISMNYIIMRETLPCLPEFLEYAFSRGIHNLSLMGLDPTRNTYDQDIYRNPDALAQIPDWRSHLQKARGISRKYANPEVSTALGNLIKTLETLKNVDRSVYPTDNPLDLLKSASIIGRKVCVWGTGGHYRSHFADWLEENRDQFDFLGFIDNDNSKWGTAMDGAKIFSPTEAATLDPEVVVLAVTRQFRDVIRDQIINEMNSRASIV